MRARGGAAHACKTRRLMVVLLLCVIPAAVQYWRYTHWTATGLCVRPRHIVYELLGEAARPGIYRYRAMQTPAALAEACGAAHPRSADTGKPVPCGTRMLFTGSTPRRCHMHAAALISYGLPVSLAAASADDLELIPGIGPKTARALIDYQKNSGPVHTIEALLNVKGIGPAKLKKIARYLRP